jgi:hypothetical protein
MNQRRRFAFVAAALLASVYPLSAQGSGEDCSDLVVNRSFTQGFTQGYLNVPMYFGSLSLAPPPDIGLVPTAGGGFVTFLPHGKLAGQQTLVVGLLGIQPDMPVDNSSQYTLTWDKTKTPAVCSGTMTVNSSAVSAHFQLRVSQDGQEIDTIHSDTGISLAVSGFAMDTAGCRVDTLKGLYSYQAKGWSLSPQTPPLIFSPAQLLAGYYPFVMSGHMNFNPGVLRPLTPGSGYVTWGDSVGANGVIVQRAGTGWYKVNPNCTGTIALFDPTLGYEFHLELFIGKNAGALYFVNTDTITVPGAPGPLPMHVLGMTVTRVNNQ